MDDDGERDTKPDADDPWGWGGDDAAAMGDDGAFMDGDAEAEVLQNTVKALRENRSWQPALIADARKLCLPKNALDDIIDQFLHIFRLIVV